MLIFSCECLFCFVAFEHFSTAMHVTERDGNVIFTLKIANIFLCLVPFFFLKCHFILCFSKLDVQSFMFCLETNRQYPKSPFTVYMLGCFVIMVTSAMILFYGFTLGEKALHAFKKEAVVGFFSGEI